MYQVWVQRIKDEQRRGEIDASIPAEQIVLLFLAEGLFPTAFPQLVRLVTNKEPN